MYTFGAIVPEHFHDHGPSAVFSSIFLILCTASITAQLQPLDLFLARIDSELNYYRPAGRRIVCKSGNGNLVRRVRPLSQRQLVCQIAQFDLSL